jgi:hypothetical protein
MKRVLRFLRNAGELALAGVLLVAAFVTSPLWLAWLSWRWWLQLREVEKQQRAENMRTMHEYVSSGEFARDWTSSIDDAARSEARFVHRIHALPDDPA